MDIQRTIAGGVNGVTNALNRVQRVAGELVPGNAARNNRDIARSLAFGLPSSLTPNAPIDLITGLG